MKYLLIFIAAFTLACNNAPATSEQTVQPVVNIDGAALFNAKCAVCHRCEGDYTGPALKGSAERWNDDKALYDFVRNSQAVIQTNVYARKLYEKYNSTYMTPFPELTDAAIAAILDYCKDAPKP